MAESCTTSTPTDDVLAPFSAPVRAWFSTTFAAPTAAQSQGWPAISSGQHTLILAPTGSGKTLTAFLWAIDRLMTSPVPAKDQRLRVVYVSPLRALAVDVDRNLRAPIEGIRLAAERLRHGGPREETRHGGPREETRHGGPREETWHGGPREETRHGGPREEIGEQVHRPTVGVRTGDTPQAERERMRRTPPDVLITTPESLYLMLTSRTRESLRSVQTVIVDEIHAMAPTKRGSHLALTLERLEHEVRRGGLAEDEPPRPAPQRVALSATQRPLDEIARFLGGHDDGRPRPVTIVDAGVRKPLELQVVVPVPDMADLGSELPDTVALPLSGGPAAAGPARRSIWPAVHPRLLDFVLDHHSTLIFVNARRMAERLAAKLNELHALREQETALRAEGLSGADLDAALDEHGRSRDAPPPELVKAHHGSLSRERRLAIEDELKSGRLRGLVATSSLELGIDMGAVDLVVQVSSPGSVARGLQRIGRAGHQVGEPSRGVLFPKFRGDLVETAVVVQRMHAGEIESTRYPRNPLDVLAQQIVAMVAMDEWSVEDIAALVRRSAPFAELSEDVLHAVLDLLAGRYPSDEFSELRPRVVWDRVSGTVRGRAGAQRLAVTNPGTIPDRGLFGVFLPDGTRVGELDEEMVHESRPGETFVLGASTWRIEDITHERVVVTPAPGEPGKLPFWHGDGPGRPAELGRAIGAFHREVLAASVSDRDAEVARLQAEADLDPWAADNLVAYLEEQAQVTGSLPDDRTIVVERFRDELGDWRVCLLSPFGAQVHAPWAMAIERRLRAVGLDPEMLWADDGIVVRLQEAEEEIPLEELLLDPDEVEALVVEQLAGTALFTTIFREAAGRALLLPKRRPGQRTALWQQRQRAAGLLQVASRYPSFPILLEATRECLQDVFDLPGLRQLLADLQSRKVRLVTVETASASPFAQSLLFGWVGQYMYEYDAPLAERRAAALALDADLLRELLGGDELRDLLDAEVLAALERELQHLPPLATTAEDVAPGAGREDVAPGAGREDVAPGAGREDVAPGAGREDVEVGLDRRARDADELHDVLRRLGDLSVDELAERSHAEPGDWLRTLVAERRAIEIRMGGEARYVAAEDASRMRDAIGVALPPGLPAAFTDPVEDPLGDLVARYARTHGPFTLGECAARLTLPVERVEATLRWLQRQDRVLTGEFRPGGVQREWVDREVLRRLKRRSLAALRAEVEPVDPAALGRFLPVWHQVRSAAGRPRRGLDALVETVAQLQGAPIPASVLETDVLPARIEGYRPGDLDQLIAAGEVVWLGVESLGASDGRLVLCFRDQVHLLAPDPMNESPDQDVHAALRAHLAHRGASFWPELFSASGVADQDLVLAALWDLVWSGEVTNDTYAPIRALGTAKRSSGGRAGGRPRPGRLTRLGPPSAQGRWSLTAGLLEPTPTATERAHALAEQLLERHGVLTREALRIEAVTGGFSAVYPVLKAMEEAGQVRRGYVVAGLGAAQFAASGAIDRLRSHREDRENELSSGADGLEDGRVIVLAATDPAQPYGAALAWPDSPGRPARAAGAFAILVDGRPALFVERGGRTISTFPHPVPPGLWLAALGRLVRSGRLRKLEVTKVDGAPVHERPEWVTALADVGFTAGYRGMTLRA